MQNKDSKLRYAAKGSTITHAGYETGIHALPGTVKSKLDSYLRSRYSPAKILARLSQEFPDVSLPSRSALYNYRKRYFEKSVVSATPVAKIEEVFDADKINLKSLVVSHVKRFVAADLPELRERWYRAMENDQGKTQLSRETREATKLYIEAVKVSMDIMPKLNITVELIEEKPQVEPEMTDAQKHDVYDKLARLINNKAEGLARMGRPITAETLQRGY
jgi:RNA processing factor Prp31